MNANEWRAAFGRIARETMSSPELQRYFSIPITRPRAQLLLKQLSLYVRHRRDCWAYVSGNCPVLAVKRKILAHEYEETVRDEHSEHGHLDLLIRQGRSIGLDAEEILGAEPIASTKATLCAWGWICKKKSWLEGLAAMTITEWNQDDRLLADLGGGHAARMGERWIESLGLTWDDLPNWKAHRAADKEHVDMFLAVWEEFGAGENELLILQAARESEELYRVYQAGIADAMEALP
ncbi:MAG TPA: iron-containing redox enzyme family protein [candidate division Zixibacteria bacterium]|nr:iron-containing redox enzyme family protein [candidate division Zixibacteria bacterium]